MEDEDALFAATGANQSRKPGTAVSDRNDVVDFALVIGMLKWATLAPVNASPRRMSSARRTCGMYQVS